MSDTISADGSDQSLRLQEAIARLRAVLKGEPSTQVPVNISETAWNTGLVIDTEVEVLFQSYGLYRHSDNGKLKHAIAKMVQLAINEELDKVRAELPKPQ